ncbi:MAG: hypothetical protein ACP5OX_01475 [Minisyncoccia bacterium]
MGWILDEIREVRQGLEKLDKNNLKKYIKEKILPQIKVIDNGYEPELIYPRYKLFELMSLPNFYEAIRELEKDPEIQIEIHNLILAIQGLKNMGL